MWARAAGIAELSDGYEIRFDPDGPGPSEIVRLIEGERACCPFLRFSLELEPDQGPIRLRITGPAETKAFLADELGLASP